MALATRALAPSKGLSQQHRTTQAVAALWGLLETMVSLVLMRGSEETREPLGQGDTGQGEDYQSRPSTELKTIALESRYLKQVTQQSLKTTKSASTFCYIFSCSDNRFLYLLETDNSDKMVHN